MHAAQLREWVVLAPPKINDNLSRKYSQGLLHSQQKYLKRIGYKFENRCNLTHFIIC